MSQQEPVEGWYPVDDNHERFWNGVAWSDATRPRASAKPTDEGGPDSNKIALAGVLVASLFGLIMSMQSASLMTGTGTIWFGVAMALGAAVFAFVFKLRRWVKVVVVIVAILGIANVISVESSLSDMREDISQIGE